MSEQTLNSALKMANSGLADQGYETLKPFLLDEKFKAPARMAMGYCREKAGKLAEARYLYSEVLRLVPGNQSWVARFQTCDEAYATRIEEARKRKPGVFLLLSSLACLFLGGLAGGVLATGSIGEMCQLAWDFMLQHFDFDSREHAAKLAAGGLAPALVGALLFVRWFANLLARRRAVREAIGEDYSDARHIPCGACGLRYRKKLKACPFCDSPGEKPKSVPPLQPDEPPPLPTVPSSESSEPPPLPMETAESDFPPSLPKGRGGRSSW